MQLINLTDHDVAIFKSRSSTVPQKVIRPSGRIARLESRRIHPQHIGDGILAYTQMYKAIQGLPASREGIFYITAGVVRQYAVIIFGRTDVLSPGPKMYKSGRVVGCIGLNGPILPPEGGTP